MSLTAIALAFASLVALAPTELSPKPLAPLTPSQDLTALTDAELLKLVRDKKNRVDRKIFEELGRRKTASSFETLTEATDLVTSVWALRYGYQAFTAFKGAGELEAAAIEELFDKAKASDPLRSSAATYALSKFGEQVHEKLERVLKSSKDPRTRSTALAPLLPSLSLSGSKSALATTCKNLVLTYMVHRPLGVESFKTFAGSAGPEALGGKLADKRLSVEVRGMILTALEETSGEASTAALMRGLGAKEPRVIYESLRSLARRGDKLHLKELSKLIRHKDDSVRREALISEARILGGDPTYAEKALDLAEHKKPVERCAAAIALSEIKTVECMQALHLLLKDKDRSVRAEALLAVAAARHVSSIPQLIMNLDSLSGSELYRTVAELRSLTGLSLGRATKSWESWWKDTEASFQMPSAAEAQEIETERSERRASNETQSKFYGLNISSERVSFVIDLSGSMNFKARGGKTRLEVLRAELDHFLKDFPSGQLFNLIFFGNDAVKWQPELTIMNEAVRADARAHVKALKAPGATAIYDGLLAAFEDPRVDTICLLTDGGPSGGTIDDIDEILAEVGRWNSLRHLVINAVAVGRDSPLLRRLADQSHGEYLRVD